MAVPPHSDARGPAATSPALRGPSEEGFVRSPSYDSISVITLTTLIVCQPPRLPDGTCGRLAADTGGLVPVASHDLRLAPVCNGCWPLSTEIAATAHSVRTSRIVSGLIGDARHDARRGQPSAKPTAN